MKRAICLCTILFLLFSTPIYLDVSAEQAITTEKYSIRVVVDGKVNVVDAVLHEGDWYLPPADIMALLGINVPATFDGLSNLRAAAQLENVNYEHDSILDAAYIWTDESYDKIVVDDYTRAISLGIVPDALLSKSQESITPKEFGEILTEVVRKIDPTKVGQFEQNVLPALSISRPMLRGEGFVMGFYAAECIGGTQRNNSFDHLVIPGDHFWDISGCNIDELFPHAWDGPVDGWNDYFTAAFLWAVWHNSPVSDTQVFEYDPNVNSMRQMDKLTVREAICAASRIYDSYIIPVEWAALDDTRALNYDKKIITNELLSKANTLPKISIDNMPVWRGLVLSHGNFYESRKFLISEDELRLVANWGFNSIRIMVTYQTLFDDKVQAANLNNLTKLDGLIAAAMKYNLHVDLVTFSLPGRWTNTDFVTYQSTASLDLFTNPARQKEAKALWTVLAQRYKDVPSATLSFCPIWEAQNYNLSSGLPYKPYKDSDVAKVYRQIVDAIKAVDPNRFIVFEPTASNGSDQILRETKKTRSSILDKYPDSLMIVNFCENPYVYANMTAVEGDHIDYQNHSMFKPEYPTTYYATQRRISKNQLLSLDGALVAGTKIDIYLDKVNGKGQFTIMADGQELYSERLATVTYNAGPPLSRYYSYAKSDKLISVVLPQDVKTVSIGYSGKWFEWSGMDVTLPEKFSVKRCWITSAYDAMLAGTQRSDPMLKDTSNIIISPVKTGATQVTIHPDVTYSTPVILAQSNKETIEAWAKELSAYSPQMIVRFEGSVETNHDSALRYYGDLLSTLNKYGFSWFSNDYWSMLNAAYFYAGVTPVKYKDINLDVEMLKFIQQYQ